MLKEKVLERGKINDGEGRKGELPERVFDWIRENKVYRGGRSLGLGYEI